MPLGQFPAPRPFQVTAHERLREGFAQGHRCQIIAASTGSGKTYIGLNIVRETLAKGRRAVFVCDRTALIEQTSVRADEYGLTDHAIIQADHWRRDITRPFQIASIQTIDKRGYWPEADVIIIDECHTQHSAWVDHIKTTSAAVIGLTATPCSKGLGQSFTNIVSPTTMHELTQSGVLVPLRILSCVTPDMTGATMRGGEWTNKAASEREMTIIGDVVGEWMQHGENRKTIAFGADIAYCMELARRFNESGIWAECYTSETPDPVRETLLKEFRQEHSRIRLLISVEALAKGFDVQDIGCVIDARPLRKSLSTAIQMWGRGLRSSVDTGKRDCLLLDHSGNFRRFLPDFEDIYFNGFKTLDDSEKLDRTVRKDDEDWTPAGCPSCGHKPFSRRCMACGFEKETRALVNTDPGQMQEIRIGKNVIASDRYDLWRQLCTYATKSAKPHWRAFFLYRDITGEAPPKDWQHHSTPIAPISRGTLNKIRSLGIAYRKGQEKRLQL